MGNLFSSINHLPQWIWSKSQVSCCCCQMLLSWLRLLATLWMSDVHSVLSSQPCSAPVDSRLWLLLWSHSISYFVFLFSCSLLFFPALLSFPKNPAFSWFVSCLKSLKDNASLYFLNVALLDSENERCYEKLYTNKLWHSMWAHIA